MRSWKDEDRVRVQGFSGYKVGMAHAMMIDDFPHSPTYGEEIAVAATIIETPPIRACGIRAYKKDQKSLKILHEVWEKNPMPELKRVFPAPQNFDSQEFELKEASEIRMITHTIPKNSGLKKKKPEIMEYPLSGPITESYTYAKKLLGKEIKVSDVFEEGEFVDVISITKGKGFQSPLKKWGIKHLPRKTRKGHATAGTLGPWHPSAMMWTVPQSGQMGYHQRTEYNKRILKLGKAKDINPKGGFLGYGIIKGDYVILHGSVPGPRKRLIRLRPAIRPYSKTPEGKPQLTRIIR
jgi:large subunit ribosomal protein L3